MSDIQSLAVQAGACLSVADKAFVSCALDWASCPGNGTIFESVAGLVASGDENKCLDSKVLAGQCVGSKACVTTSDSCDDPAQFMPTVEGCTLDKIESFGSCSFNGTSFCAYSADECTTAGWTWTPHVEGCTSCQDVMTGVCQSFTDGSATCGVSQSSCNEDNEVYLKAANILKREDLECRLCAKEGLEKVLPTAAPTGDKVEGAWKPVVFDASVANFALAGACVGGDNAVCALEASACAQGTTFTNAALEEAMDCATWEKGQELFTGMSYGQCKYANTGASFCVHPSDPCSDMVNVTFTADVKDCTCDKVLTGACQNAANSDLRCAVSAGACNEDVETFLSAEIVASSFKGKAQCFLCAPKGYTLAPSLVPTFSPTGMPVKEEVPVAAPVADAPTAASEPTAEGGEAPTSEGESPATEEKEKPSGTAPSSEEAPVEAPVVETGSSSAVVVQSVASLIVTGLMMF